MRNLVSNSLSTSFSEYSQYSTDFKLSVHDSVSGPYTEYYQDSSSIVIRCPETTLTGNLTTLGDISVSDYGTIQPGVAFTNDYNSLDNKPDISVYAKTDQINNWSNVNNFLDTVTVLTLPVTDNSTNAASTSFVQSVASATVITLLQSDNTWTGPAAFTQSPIIPDLPPTTQNTQAVNANFVHAVVSTSNANSATNLAGGLANQIPYQISPGITGFIPQPTVIGTYLNWDGTSYNWTSSSSTGVTSLNTLVSGVTIVGLSDITVNVSGQNIEISNSNYVNEVWIPVDNSGDSLVLTSNYATESMSGNIISFTTSITYPVNSSSMSVSIDGLTTPADNSSIFTGISDSGILFIAKLSGTILSLFDITNQPLSNKTLSGDTIVISGSYQS